MILKPNSVWIGQFTVVDDTGALVDADSLPTGTLVLDGVNDGATVTIANVSTGVYTWSVTVPGGATAGQLAQIRIAATIATIATGGGVAEGQVDTVYGSDLSADLATVDGIVDAILVDTDTTIPGLIAALNDLSAAQVNAEVVDVLNVDTFSQPGQEAPAATTTLAAMLRYLYKAWRNKKVETSSLQRLYNDAGAVIDQERTISSDGATLTVGKIGTGT